jgi:hypothetical protein
LFPPWKGDKGDEMFDATAIRVVFGLFVEKISRKRMMNICKSVIPLFPPSKGEVNPKVISSIFVAR